MKIIEMVKAYGGLIVGKKDYWHPDMIVAKDISKDRIGSYYVDARPNHIYPAEFDENNIPLLNIDGENKYFPVTIAQYALGNFDMYLDTKDEKYFDVCINCANWFVENLGEITPGLYGYINDYDESVYKLKSPWLSTLAQGQVMSLLSRCYSVNHNKDYKECAKKLLKSYTVLNNEKGTLAYLNGKYFYEEYPSDTPSFVLNGFIFSLWGLLDFYKACDSDEAYRLYEQGLESLIQNLQYYDIKKIHWSKYDLYPFKIENIASIFYHNLHIEQLKAMYLLTDNNVFQEYYLLWEKAKNNKFIYIKATIYKIRHKLSVKNESSYVPSVSKEK